MKRRALPLLVTLIATTGCMQINSAGTVAPILASTEPPVAAAPNSCGSEYRCPPCVTLPDGSMACPACAPPPPTASISFHRVTSVNLLMGGAVEITGTGDPDQDRSEQPVAQVATDSETGACCADLARRARDESRSYRITYLDPAWPMSPLPMPEPGPIDPQYCALSN